MTQVPNSRVQRRIYAGMLGTVAAARLLMPLASRVFGRAEYEYDDNEGRGVFLGTSGATVYAPERCKIMPLGSGEAILQVEGDDNEHEWFVSGIPALDGFREGQQLDAGAELGKASDDLLMGLEVYPKGGGQPIVSDPLTVLQNGKANFKDLSSGESVLQPPRSVDELSSREFQEHAQQQAIEAFKRGPEPVGQQHEIEVRAPETVKTNPLSVAPPAAEVLAKGKPQFTQTDVIIMVGVTAALTGLIVYGFSRTSRRGR